MLPRLRKKPQHSRPQKVTGAGTRLGAHPAPTPKLAGPPPGRAAAPLKPRLPPACRTCPRWHTPGVHVCPPARPRAPGAVARRAPPSPQPPTLAPNKAPAGRGRAAKPPTSPPTHSAILPGAPPTRPPTHPWVCARLPRGVTRGVTTRGDRAHRAPTPAGLAQSTRVPTAGMAAGSPAPSSWPGCATQHDTAGAQKHTDTRAGGHACGPSAVGMAVFSSPPRGRKQRPAGGTTALRGNRDPREYRQRGKEPAITREGAPAEREMGSPGRGGERQPVGEGPAAPGTPRLSASPGAEPSAPPQPRATSRQGWGRLEDAAARPQAPGTGHPRCNSHSRSPNAEAAKLAAVGVGVGAAGGGWGGRVPR